MIKKLVSIIIVICLAFSLVACKNDKQVGEVKKTEKKTEKKTGEEIEKKEESNITAPGELPIVKEKVTISAFMRLYTNVEDYETNSATIELEKRTNIHLDFVVVPHKIEEEKKQLLLASGNYPEIFLSGHFKEEDIMNYGAKEGIFIPLNNLIDEYCVEIPKTDEERDGFLDSITTPDGNIYGIPSINDCFHCIYNPKYWINTQWLDNLGLEVPQTTEEFYQVLKAFKNDDPNQNGKQDEIPISGAIKTWFAEPQHFLMNSFIYTNKDTYLRSHNGKLDFVANKPEFKEGITYMKKLYDDGLIDPASFTQDLTQFMQIANQDELLVGAGPGGHLKLFLEYGDDRERAYHALAPLEGPEGVRQSGGGVYGTGRFEFAITDKCENPEAAMRLCDYIYTEEGTLLLNFGPEGTQWKKAEPGQLDLMGRPAKWDHIYYASDAETQNDSWNQEAPLKRLSEFVGYRGFWAVNQDFYALDGYEKRLFDATKNEYEPYTSEEKVAGLAWLPVDKLAEVGQSKKNIVDYVNQYTLRFITGDLDLEKDWDKYIKGLENLNVQEYVNVYAEGYKMEAEQQ